jgi:hypothetical protein
LNEELANYEIKYEQNVADRDKELGSRNERPWGWRREREGLIDSEQELQKQNMERRWEKNIQRNNGRNFFRIEQRHESSN